MPIVRSCPIPDAAFLHGCLREGAFADCYVVSIEGIVEQSAFVGAFYTTALFKVERLILRWIVNRPSTDAEAIQLGFGKREHFAAWCVERQDAHQLLLCDHSGRTRSWLMATAQEGPAPAHTLLYFGSAVVPRRHPGSGKTSLGTLFGALLGFHKLYSRLLLRAAHARLLRQRL
jgi:hypothetical protein